MHDKKTALEHQTILHLRSIQNPLPAPVDAPVKKEKAAAPKASNKVKDLPDAGAH